MDRAFAVIIVLAGLQCLKTLPQAVYIWIFSTGLFINDGPAIGFLHIEDVSQFFHT